MDINIKKKYVAGLSIASNVVLTVLKIFAGIISGSLSIISEAIHSFSDLFASLLTYFSVIKSAEPADADHPYGHGRYEDFAGLIEGILIILASFFIIYKSATKIISGAIPESESMAGIAVMLLAVISNIIVSTMLFSTAKESNSVALQADGEHLRTDVYSSLGVLIGLVLIKISGHYIFDPIIAILIAAYIFKAGNKISQKALSRLMDHSLPNEDIDKIKDIIKEYSDVVTLKENSIKSRQIGAAKDLDLILQFPENTTICACHKICDKIEQKIQTLYSNTSISIHSEPLCYKGNCQNCKKYGE